MDIKAPQPFPVARFTHYGNFRFYYAYGNTPAEDFLDSITEVKEEASHGGKQTCLAGFPCLGDFRLVHPVCACPLPPFPLLLGCNNAAPGPQEH